MTRVSAGVASSARRELFVPARGQYENIGDILLRRQLLDWLRASGPLHVYLGNATEGYEDGLQLHKADVRYRSFAGWYLAALRSAAKGTASYIFKPGEIQLTLIGMKEHLAMLPLVALVRARGGAVARVGVGSRNFAPLPRAIMRPSIALSTISLWRDGATARYLKAGEAMPDLGFGEGSDDAIQPHEDQRRSVLVISMRSDLDYFWSYPSDDWLDAVRAVAERHQLDIWTVTQVAVDDEKSARLAHDLGGNALLWDGRAHDQQEERLRALYRRAALTISDRLHVLVAAVTEGSVPAAPLMDSSDKVSRHFAAAGIHDITVPGVGLGAGEIAERLDALIARRAAIMGQLQNARADLDEARSKVDYVLRSVPAR